MPQESHVLIIGAGLTGLLIAHGLSKHGIPYTIFETEPEGASRPREWTMGVHWGFPLMEQLLPDKLRERLISEGTVDPTLDYVTPPTNGSRIYDGVTGEVLKELVSEGKLVRVSRRKLRKLLREGIEVKFGHRLQLLETSPDASTVTATFDNGHSYTGTLAIGADGPRSTVRSILFNHSATAQCQPLPGIVHLSTTFSYNDASKAQFVRAAHPVWSMMIHPDIFTYICIQDTPDPNDPATWVFFLFICWLGEKDPSLSSAEVMRLVRQKGDKIQEPFRSAILWIPEDVMLPYVEVASWVAEPWDTRSGRVTLAGDAAHPMPPYRGQGLNHAIQDAWNVVDVMRKVNEGQSQAELVDEYSEEVVKRGAEETKLSTKNAYMAVGYEDFKNSPYMRHGLSKQ